MANSPDQTGPAGLCFGPIDPMDCTIATASSGIRLTISQTGTSRTAAASPRAVSWAPEVEVREITPLDSSTESSFVGPPVKFYNKNLLVQWYKSYDGWSESFENEKLTNVCSLLKCLVTNYLINY